MTTALTIPEIEMNVPFIGSIQVGLDEWDARAEVTKGMVSLEYAAFLINEGKLSRNWYIGELFEAMKKDNPELHCDEEYQKLCEKVDHAILFDKTTWSDWS